MDTQDNSNTPPDSWEQEADAGSGDQDGVNSATKSMAGLGLNVNAPPFIPGQNPYAAEFVPSMPSNTSEGGFN